MTDRRPVTVAMVLEHWRRTSEFALALSKEAQALHEQCERLIEWATPIEEPTKG